MPRLGAFWLLAAAPVLIAASPFAGRWDLTLTASGTTYPSWIEIADEGATPAVRIVGRTGSVHPGQNVKAAGDRISFTSNEGSWEISAHGRKLAGTLRNSAGAAIQLSGVPAPDLKRSPPAAWSNPELLFNGRDLAGWETDNPAKSHWTVENGELRNDAAGANIRTMRKFDDFKLHIEFNCPEGGNSGVHLRGRYEVQIEYEPAGKNDRFHAIGSLYGFLAPSTEVSPRPGQWEAYDVTLVGRTVTVVRDGVTIIEAEEIPGITGGAMDSHEADPGPISLQGDHTGGLKFRNITISLAAR